MASDTTDRLAGMYGNVALKPPVRAATTANITLSGEQTIDGIAVVANDRVLVKDQTTASENGIYIAGTGTWARAKDFNGARDAVTGTMVKVTSGTTNGGYIAELTTTGTITVGSTSLAFSMRIGTLGAVSSFMGTVLDDTTAAAARTTLGAGAVGGGVFTAATAAAAQQAMDTEVGVDVQAYDADLTAIAALSHTRGNVAQSNGTAWVNSAALLPDNLLINGSFDIWQRGTAFTAASTPANSDDTYLADRWVNLSDGNDIVDVSQETTTIPSTGALSAIKLDVETANKKFGILQILEQKDAIAIIGGTASLAFEARKGGSNATVDTLRAAIISWDGTADTVTSDVVSAWGAEGADPTLVANWTYENVPANLTLTASFQEFRVENASIDTASAKNVAVFIWCDNADATILDLVYISKVRLVPGAVATPIKRRLFGEELALCQRYYTKTFPLATAPAEGAGLDGALGANCHVNPSEPQYHWRFCHEMRGAPTVLLFNPRAAGTDAQWDNNSATSSANARALQPSTSGVILDNADTGLTGGGAVTFYIHATADAEL